MKRMKFSNQIVGFTINARVRKQRKDPPSTTLVLELSDGAVRHRTCFNEQMQIVADEVLSYPVDMAEEDFDENDLFFTVEAR